MTASFGMFIRLTLEQFFFVPKLNTNENRTLTFLSSLFTLISSTFPLSTWIKCKHTKTFGLIPALQLFLTLNSLSKISSTFSCVSLSEKNLNLYWTLSKDYIKITNRATFIMRFELLSKYFKQNSRISLRIKLCLCISAFTTEMSLSIKRWNLVPWRFKVLQTV